MDEESLAVAMKVLMKARDSEVEEARSSHAKELAAKKAEFHGVILKRDQEGIQIDVQITGRNIGTVILIDYNLKLQEYEHQSEKIKDFKKLLKLKDKEIQYLKDRQDLQKLDRATTNSSTKYYSIPRNYRTDKDWKKLLRKVFKLMFVDIR